MIEALLATLERDAANEISRITEDARVRAAELGAAGEQRIAARRAAALAGKEADARVLHGRALAAARATARARVLAARAALLDRVFATLTASLPALVDSDAYRGQLAHRIAAARRFAGDRQVMLECNPSLASTVRRLVRTNGRLPVRPDAGILAGFRLRAEDQSVEIDATLENQLERLRPQLALEALAALSS